MAQIADMYQWVSDAASSLHRSYSMRAVAGIALLSSVWSAHAAMSPYVPNVERGRALYEQRCEQCHTPRSHTRPIRLPLGRDELRGIVDQMRRLSNLGWTPDEIEDVVEHLDRTYYRFPPER